MAIGNYHLGVRAHPETALERLRSLLLPVAVDADAPDNLSLRIADAGSPGPDAASCLYEGYEVVARSEPDHTLIELLLRRLDGFAHRDDELVALRGVAFCSRDEAILLPPVLGSMLPRLAAPFARVGYRWSGHAALLDPVTAELVLPEISIPVDADELATLRAASEADTSVLPRPGRYRIRSWLLSVSAEEDTAEGPGPADLLPRLIASVDQPQLHAPTVLEELLEQVQAAAEVHPALPVGSARRLAERLSG